MLIGVGELLERLSHVLEPNFTGDQWRHVKFSISDLAERLGELVGLVRLHETKLGFLREGLPRVAVTRWSGGECLWGHDSCSVGVKRPSDFCRRRRW